jgi:hypothetical protein
MNKTSTTLDKIRQEARVAGLSPNRTLRIIRLRLSGTAKDAALVQVRRNRIVHEDEENERSDG